MTKEELDITKEKAGLFLNEVIREIPEDKRECAEYCIAFAATFMDAMMHNQKPPSNPTMSTPAIS